MREEPQEGNREMKKIAKSGTVFFALAALVVSLMLTACSHDAPRLPAVYTYNPGAPFTTNVNDEDPRRLVKCAVVFEVIDEAAAVDLAAFNFVIRNAVITVLSSLTVEELTVNRDLQEISQRLVDQVNASIYGQVNLIVGAYFTEFTLT